MRGSVCTVIPYVCGNIDTLVRAVSSVEKQCNSTDKIVVIDYSVGDQDISRDTLKGFKEVSVVAGRPEDPQGVFSRVLEEWFNSDAEFVSWLSPMNEMGKDRLSNQISLIGIKGLSACYGDVLFVDPKTSKPTSLSETREFSHSMIGLESFSTETMLIDRSKFMEAGGFDHILAASYKPKAYIVTMAALGGRIERCPTVALIDHKGLEIFPSPKSLADELAPSARRELWTRIRFESFLSRAKKAAECNWKN